MNRDEEAEASRPRPLSGGIWTLFSWLRRSERSSSSESVSSIGSDRTAASFDFLSPIHYRLSAPPILLSPKSPTDSYKKRVHERNLRRQRERDITLHRKYGLWREDGTGYDAFSLPSASKITELGNKQARCRRAASECLQRRAAYVPGKRQAPLPPTIKSTSLPRSYKRKRPAPKPPAERVEANKENIEINNNHLSSSFSSSLKIYELKSDSLKQDKPNKDVKLRSEKNFIKQIFESKRNSAIKISPNKLLPSISELDKQAAEIIETNKMIRSFENNNSIKGQGTNELEQILTSGNMWTCTKCLRRYNKTIKSCVYCIPKLDTSHGTNIYTQTDLHGQNVVKIKSKVVDDNEKKKLKEMLKEMKDSLPKKTKEIKLNTHTECKDTNSPTEFPTLRIGSTLNDIENHQNLIQVREHSNTLDSNNIINVGLTQHTSAKIEATTSNQTPKQLTVNTKLLEIKRPNEIAVKSPSDKIEQDKAQTKINHVTRVIEVQEINKNQVKETLHGNKDPQSSHAMDIQLNPMNIGKNISIHTPLKISSLLNPIYLPKNTNEILVCSSTSNIDKDVSVNDSDTKVHINPASSKFSPVNKCRLEPEIVSQIIKKSIEEKQKRLLQKEEKKESKGPVTSNMGHSERRDLINQLELSIAKGDEKAAAEAAVKLAKLRLSCSVLSFSSQIIGEPSTSNACADYGNKINVKPQSNQNATPLSEATTSVNANREIVDNKKCLNENKSGKNEKEIHPILEETSNQVKEEPTESNTATDDRVNISIWIEDKIAARGPIELNISRRAKIVDLRQEAENSFGLAIRLQRWIIGKTLCTDDSVPIVSLAGSDFATPFYLCLVESGDANGNTEAAKQDTISGKSVSGEFYTELIKLEQQALVTNSEQFECGVCMEDCAAGNGAVLRECIHTFCRECLSDVVRHCEEPVVPCPAIGCPGALQDREIRALLTTEDYEKWLARGLAAAENGTRNTFHCRTTDCSGWAFCEPGVRRFPCPVCKHTNCVPCQAVHEGDTCEQYQRKLRETVAAVETNSDEGTQALLNSLISRGEALECPECRSIITKKWGCDWVKCSACKTEICWITKGRRWGPGGRGDTSGGCRCGIDGKRCHPSCGYCH